MNDAALTPNLDNPKKPAEQRAFSILIPSWNNLAFLKCCIQSIRKNSVYTHQIIVHANEGVDGTLDWLEAAQIPFTHTRENVGVCTALNKAYTQASNDWILYLNDDMYVAPEWDLNLWRFMDAIDTCDFYLSATMVEPVKTANACAVAPYNFGTHPREFNETAFCKEAKTLYRKNWSGGTWPPSLVHRKWWEAVGGYSEEFSPGMYSDPDFSMKLWAAGLRTYVGVGDSLVYHFMSKSVGRVVKNNGRKQFMQKWGLSARFFKKYFLREGGYYQGPLVEPSFLRVKVERLITRFKV